MSKVLKSIILNALMKQIPLATKSQRYKDTHGTFRVFEKVKKINKMSSVSVI